jgi:L-aspartate oxidase
MWRSAGVFRMREGLVDLVARLESTAAHEQTRLGATADTWRRVHLVTVARLMAGAALRREESRGGHFRADFPARDDARWRIHMADRLV